MSLNPGPRAHRACAARPIPAEDLASVPSPQHDHQRLLWRCSVRRAAASRGELRRSACGSSAGTAVRASSVGRRARAHVPRASARSSASGPSGVRSTRLTSAPLRSNSCRTSLPLAPRARARTSGCAPSPPAGRIAALDARASARCRASPALMPAELLGASSSPRTRTPNSLRQLRTARCRRQRRARHRRSRAPGRRRPAAWGSRVMKRRPARRGRRSRSPGRSAGAVALRQRAVAACAAARPASGDRCRRGRRCAACCARTRRPSRSHLIVRRRRACPSIAGLAVDGQPAGADPASASRREARPARDSIFCRRSAGGGATPAGLRAARTRGAALAPPPARAGARLI